MPHPYESFYVGKFLALEQDLSHKNGDLTRAFTSMRFGDPGYAQLSEAAPQFLQRGAENGSEMGAFSSLLNPIKFDGLMAKIQEYAPFGLTHAPIFET